MGWEAGLPTSGPSMAAGSVMVSMTSLTSSMGMSPITRSRLASSRVRFSGSFLFSPAEGVGKVSQAQQEHTPTPSVHINPLSQHHQENPNGALLPKGEQKRKQRLFAQPGKMVWGRSINNNETLHLYSGLLFSKPFFTDYLIHSSERFCAVGRQGLFVSILLVKKQSLGTGK